MPFIRPKGSPKVPGSGRRRGTRNRRTVAASALASELLNDVGYQYRLRRDFTRRRVHPVDRDVNLALRGHGRQAQGVHPNDRQHWLQRAARRGARAVQPAERRAARTAGSGESEALVDKAMALASANAQKTQMLVGAAPAPVAGVDIATGEPAESSPAPKVSDQRDVAAADIAPRDTP